MHGTGIWRACYCCCCCRNEIVQSLSHLSTKLSNTKLKQMKAGLQLATRFETTPHRPCNNSLQWHYLARNNLVSTGSGIVFSLVWFQAYTWNGTYFLTVGYICTNVNDIWIKIQQSPLRNLQLNLPSIKWWPFCLNDFKRFWAYFFHFDDPIKVHGNPTEEVLFSLRWDFCCVWWHTTCTGVPLEFIIGVHLHEFFPNYSTIHVNAQEVWCVRTSCIPLLMCFISILTLPLVSLSAWFFLAIIIYNLHISRKVAFKVFWVGYFIMWCHQHKSVFTYEYRHFYPICDIFEYKNICCVL